MRVTYGPASRTDPVATLAAPVVAAEQFILCHEATAFGVHFNKMRAFMSTSSSVASLSLAEKTARVGKYAVILPRNSNQAQGIAKYAIDFIKGGLGSGPAESVKQRVELFHTDSVVCGVSALALKTRAPVVLREEAIQDYKNPEGAFCFGSSIKVSPEKAIVANSAAVREWDSNGTVFGYNGLLGKDHTAGEFGHNDFYPVVIAACQMNKYDGKMALNAMIALDEIRGRLAEVFSLKSYKIDHVVHGAVASAAVYGALMGASVEEIESAIGMVIAHYIPWRAIRAGKQLSDSKGASAAISTEVAIMSVRRAMRGFIGPRDIFRNPEAIFRFFEPTSSSDESPFDIALSHSGDDFSVMGMHFKLGLYEHQSAGALHGLVLALSQNPQIASAVDGISSIKIVAYEPAFGIIGDPAKRTPTTRQSADHSMVFIVSRKLLKAIELGPEKLKQILNESGVDGLWKQLILTPYDYSPEALACEKTKNLMSKIVFEHGGEEYDRRYPEGIPTSIVITSSSGTYDSGLVMFPPGHAKNESADLRGILMNKFEVLGNIAAGNPDSTKSMIAKLSNLESKSSDEIMSLYNFSIESRPALE